MLTTEIQRNKKGRVIGLQHKSDILNNNARSLSAVATTELYLRTVADQYQLDSKLLDGINQQVTHQFDSDKGEQLKFVSAQLIQSFSIVNLQQTFRGLSIWEHGIVVRMCVPNNCVTGSASSVIPDIKIDTIDKPPKDRQVKAEELLSNIAAKEKLSGFKITACQDLIYSYQAKLRLPPPESEGPEDQNELPSIPELDIGPAPKIKEGHFRYAAEVLFTTTSKNLGDLNWRAFIDWQTNSVLYIRPLVADVSGCVFPNDPISLSGNSQLDPTATTALLDAQREMVTLERLIFGGSSVSLSGEHVVVQDVDAPNIAPPTENASGASVFCYPADSDDFAAVCGYYTHDWLYQLVEDLGFNLNMYFDGATFPVVVDHRWANTVNAQAPGNAMGNGVLRFRYSFAASGSNVGMATDARVCAHEFGHGILWDHLSSPNFSFAHGLGDTLAAILFDPESKAPDRFRTFPFSNLILRRHDRAVESGWGWGGTRDVGSYPSSEILSTTAFRIYRSLGGDATQLEERQHASRYTAYILLLAPPLLASVVPNTKEGLSSAMQESDQGTTDFDGYSGGWAHKVVRWSFEKQSLYGGQPPAVDIYIDDGRSGEYPYTTELESAPDIWNRHREDGGTGHETPRAGIENYLYVRVSNRGSESASGVKLKAYKATSNKGKLWPNDWAVLGDTVSIKKPIPAKESVIVGPLPWCPQNICGERVLASASVKSDQSNIVTIAKPLPFRRLVLGDNNIAVRKMELNFPEEDQTCNGEKQKRLYRYSVKFVCGCSKGEVVAKGRYFTAINVRNSSDEKITFYKRFSVALPNEKPGNVSNLTRNQLGPYEALEIDCEDIARHNRIPECCFLKGFAVLESEVELDVIVVYTAAKSKGEVETIDVETVKPKRVKRKMPPDDDDIPPPPPQDPKLPDLVPVKPYPPGPPFFPSNYCESPQQLRIIVRNQGDGPAGPTTTRVEHINQDFIEEQPTPALNAGEETVLTFPIPSACVSETCPFRITVNADPVDAVIESNTINNTDNSSCGIAS